MSTMPKVYLAGPITGLTYSGATDWREKVRRTLLTRNIQGISPMRGKSYLKSLGALSGHGREYFDLDVMSQPRSVLTRDRFDVMRSDAILVNFLGTTQVSIGTCMEIAWADIQRIPIVGVMEESGNPHDHMFVTEIFGFRVTSLEEAVNILGVMFQ